MREIVFDTETTGLDPSKGDRVVEIGCVELINHIPSGETYHQYINPERSMPSGAEAVHGLSETFLSDKPVFADVADAFLKFIGDAVLIAHNANFDIGFLNMELGKLGHAAIDNSRVVDTLTLARRRHPGSPASLDALCARYGIDTSRRDLHGGLLDAELLAEVYIELIGGRQATLVLGSEPASPTVAPVRQVSALPNRPNPRSLTLAAGERAAHAAALEKLGEESIWASYVKSNSDASPAEETRGSEAG